MFKKISFTLIFLISNLFYSQSASIDPTFSIGNGFAVGNVVSTMAIQNDNKIIISGFNFSNFNGTTLNNNTIRLNSNGSYDMPLTTGGVTSVYAIAQQNDGKLIMAGDAGFNFYRIQRFNTNNTLDNSFSVGINSSNGFNARISKIVIQPDNKILLSGNFTAYSTTTTKQLTRLNNNGTLDTSFNSNINNITSINATNGVRAFKLLSNGQILVATNSSPKLIRINSNGTLDNTFSSNVTNVVDVITEQSDNKILISQFLPPNNCQLKRLNSDGTIDNSFTTYSISNAVVYNAHQISNNKILISNGNGASASTRLVLLNNNGSVDNSFNIGTGFEDDISKIIIQPDGKILACGLFTSYNGTTKRGILRLIGSSNLSLNSHTKNNINIYPNPVNEILFIENNENSEYEIIDICGKQILNGNDNQINVSSLEKGVYILKLKKEEKVLTQKFIKE